MLKKTFLSILLFFAISEAHAEEKQVDPEILFFYSSHCEECVYLKAEFFPPLKEKFSGKISWREINIDDSKENLELALRIVMGGRKTGTLTPSVAAGSTILMGTRAIESGLAEAITKMLASPGLGLDIIAADSPPPTLRNISPGLIFLSGIVDGFNPCAFAAVAFLISVMYVHSFSKAQAAIVALSYSLAVFIAYFLIGLGLFKALYSLEHFRAISLVFRYSIAGGCFLLAVISARDFMVYKRTGAPKDLILTLPDNVKKKISLLIGSRLRDNKKGLLQLSAAAFAAGAAVSCLEMICTGQVYVPTLVYILKSSDNKITSFLYLFFYNVLFVLPLIIVTVLYILGVNSRTFGDFLKKNTGWLKLALAAIFAALGTGILFF
ncbi:MAG: hypothetical protein HQL30_08400 [Candidatus Omnitrophica bacterium]|nr:hypothetical protein [Candidatus Omnitrophota bacterium]